MRHAELRSVGVGESADSSCVRVDARTTEPSSGCRGRRAAASARSTQYSPVLESITALKVASTRRTNSQPETANDVAVAAIATQSDAGPRPA